MEELTTDVAEELLIIGCVLANTIWDLVKLVALTICARFIQTTITVDLVNRF